MRKFLLLAAASLALAGCSHTGANAPRASTVSDAPVYIVFFHFDSVKLTPVAQKIIDAAAQSARVTKPARIQIAGYTEASAPPPTKKFAEPRFAAVENALVADGVDARLLVRAPLADQEADLPTTADRRVEIRLLDRASP